MFSNLHIHTIIDRKYDLLNRRIILQIDIWVDKERN